MPYKGRILSGTLMGGAAALTTATVQGVTSAPGQARIVSFSAIVPSQGGVVTLYTTPSAGSGSFVLTQICMQTPEVMTMSATDFGTIRAPFVMDEGTVGCSSGFPCPKRPQCQVYTPGLPLPPGSDVQCKNDHVSGSGGRGPLACLLIGVVAEGTSPTLGACCGDCDDNNQVSINELLTGVNHALGGCPE